MTPTLDETHDSSLSSWVESARAADIDFPIQNLPLGFFHSGEGRARPGVAIGDQIVDLSAAARHGLLDADLIASIESCIADGSLNPMLGEGRSVLARLRQSVSRLLRDDTREADVARPLAGELLIASERADLLLPMRVGDYTDFYASIHHATNVGRMFRPDNALLPNYKWVPIGYHGRASSIVVSGSVVRRPSGQTRDDPATPPTFGPTRRLDYELEVGAIIGRGSALGDSIRLRDAESHIAGLCLVNDWSARDIQSWEYQPLGPFLAKNFATTVSPWIVTLDALAPFRRQVATRADGDPAPLPYLEDANDARHGAFEIWLDVLLQTPRMRSDGHAPYRVSRGSLAWMYWTMGQLVTHHASNGCNLRPGDLLASGTVSGDTKESRGCLLERTWRGTEPLILPGGETRRFLEDGDEVTLRGWCARDGHRRIGFGECRGVISAS
ncbi:MAG: fumarylacetoacetase [Gemmatimonadaceae bacterium]